MEFKKGDIVKIISRTTNHNIEIGYMGTIIDINIEGSQAIGVEFNKDIKSGHSCNDKGKVNYCWWVNSNNLKVVGRYKIKKDYEILDEIQSKTSQKVYTIKRNVLTGKISCNCPSWIFKNSVNQNDVKDCDRRCKHIEQFFRDHGDEYEKKFMTEIDYRKEDKEYDNILNNLESLEKYV